MLESMQICNENLWGSDGIKVLHSVWAHFWSFFIYNKNISSLIALVFH